MKNKQGVKIFWSTVGLTGIYARGETGARGHSKKREARSKGKPLIFILLMTLSAFALPSCYTECHIEMGIAQSPEQSPEPIVEECDEERAGVVYFAEIKF